MRRYLQKHVRRPSLASWSRPFSAAAPTEGLPSSADVVVIGGGSIGASTLYHLSQMGVDAVLVEKDQLTAGTTWHSAGLLWRLRPSDIDIQLINHTRHLAKTLEAETGVSTGWVENGGLFIAANAERLSEYQRLATLGKYFGIHAEVLSPADTKALYPLMNVSDLKGTLYSPGDGTIDPSSWVAALAKGAKLHGAKIFEKTPVEAILTEAAGKDETQVVGVQLGGGHVIRTKRVVNAAGVWSNYIAKMVGKDIPLCAMHHAYVVTERIEGIQNMPNVRDHDASVYLKLQGDVLQVGGYEPNPIFWENVQNDFAFSLFDLDWDVFSTHINGAVNRVPIIEATGVRSTVCGPESFTPDHKALLGEMPGVRGFFLGCGFNSAGIMLAGGAGQQLAHWVTAGRPTIDMFSYDIQRYHLSMLGHQRWNRERSHEAYAKNYSIVFPHDEPLGGRNVRLTPFHAKLKAANCVFQTRHGYERPGYFADVRSQGDVAVKPYTYYGNYNHTPHADDPYLRAIEADNTFGWPGSHEIVGAEARACRETVVLFDQSYFGKFVLSGDDAPAAIEYICTNKMKGPGATVYTLMCNAAGGTECDLTVSQVDDTTFYITAGGASATHDFAWIASLLRRFPKTSLADFTDDFGVLSVQGPLSRPLLEKLTGADLSNDAFPFSTHRLVTMAGYTFRMLRLTFVGELGYELHIPKDACEAVYDALWTTGEALGIRNAGYLAMDALSVEKGYKHWHEDLRSDDTPVEAGMLFTCKLDKDFSGRDVLAKQKANGVSKKLICLTPNEHIPLKGNEAIWRDGTCVGFVRRCAFGHSVGKSVGYGYIQHPDGAVVTPKFVKDGVYEIETLNERRVPATLHTKCVFDPTNARVQGEY
ncbi:sarcosine dehydrogenase [Saprolegnia diclina VS20]|uniref:Sarcosine dehydrogenase n=1 Tax=Saprolegnia diclina (strain VS20) TaxID=1156394 RepID=T0RWZ6_SAPDV|nr:sarcosine dehydrogenase [Saprolegnia diclina VS20]EQC37078.1 sarcosine dehydrogenase [Saprolegnia diclina VS20]|eukprot:XP_008609240.1 sarcosine dehydrogenase [Saprolegnia diclina VS20]